MRIVIDRQLCCGSGNCVRTAPDVFDQDDADGLVVLHTSEPPEQRRGDVELAAQLCPSGAISLS